MHATWEGGLLSGCLEFIYCRRIIGWGFGKSKSTTLALKTLYNLSYSIHTVALSTEHM